MAVNFAIVNNSLWSSGGTWQNGSVPVAGDDVYANGFNIILDQDINVGSLRNTTSTIYLPNMSIPLMTSNSTPYGNVIASTDTTNAWKVFDQDSSTTWGPTANIVGWIGYQFTAATVIKRFYYVGNSVGYNASTFQGSLDNITWDTIHIIPNGSGSYLSPVLTSTTAYNYYRLNVGGVQFGQNMGLQRLEMTETTGTTYGATAGGGFTVPASLVGTRTITQSGTGIITNNTNIITVAANSGSTVNFNVSGGGYIFNPNSQITALCLTQLLNIAGNCIVNFNSDIWGNQLTSVGFYKINGCINIAAAATVNINGNIYGGRSGFDGANQDTVISTTIPNYTLNIIGNVFGGTVTTFTNTINPKATGIINITGNVISNNSQCINSTAAIYLNIIGNVSQTIASNNTSITTAGASVINIIGNITAPSNFPAISCGTGAATVNVPTGTITAGINGIGISAPNATLVTVAGPLINTNTVPAVLTNKMRFYSGQTAQLIVQDTTNANVTLSSISSSGVTIGLPFSGDVRYLTTYGQNNEYVGSLRVPSVDNVRKGVPTDFTVGTADLTANDIFGAITTSSNSIAIRLRNVSTVESAGDQIAALS